MKPLVICVTICAVLAAGCAALPSAPTATAVPPAPTAVPLAPIATAAQPDLVGLANAFVAALNRRDVDGAMALCTDDVEYRAGHVGVGKAQVRTVLDYLDGTLIRLVSSDCKLEGEQVSCTIFGRDDAMVVFGVPGVRFKPYTYSFKDGKIQKIMGTPDGPEWAVHTAATKEAFAWLAANRAEEWKKISNADGVLIRNGATAPILIKLLREYAGEQAKQNPPTAADPVGLANAFMAALNRRDVEGAMALCTDDVEYRAGHVGVGKSQVRTVLDYLDGTGLRVVSSDCKLEGGQVSCTVFGRDDAMAAFGVAGVSFKPYTFSFKDGKIQKIMGTPDGPEWAVHTAATKEAMTWLAANRGEAWKKVTTAEGALIRNGQSGPEIIRLFQEYAKAKQ